MNTIVSAFVSNVNSRYEDSLKTYYNFGKLLLQSSVPKIIFVDQPMFDLIGENYDNTTTLIVKINAHDSYLYGYADQLTRDIPDWHHEPVVICFSTNRHSRLKILTSFF